MSEWEPEQISRQFRFIGDEAERYFLEAKEKAKYNKSYERIYDEHLAKFAVYNYLHGRLFLATRESLVTELKRMLGNPREPLSEVLDPERFTKYWKEYVNQLISEYDVRPES